MEPFWWLGETQKRGAKRGAPPLETAMLPLIVCVSRGCVPVNISHKICARREAARQHRDGGFHAIPVCVFRCLKKNVFVFVPGFELRLVYRYSRLNRSHCTRIKDGPIFF